MAVGSGVVQGMRVYYTGSGADEDGFGEVQKVDAHGDAYILLDDGRWKVVTARWIADAYDGTRTSHFVTERAFKEWRAAGVRRLQREADERRARYFGIEGNA